MKRLFLLFCILFAAFHLVFSQNQGTSCASFHNDGVVWDTEYVDGQWYLVRGKGLDDIESDMNKLLEAWNKTSDIQIVLREIKPEYVKIEIPNSEKLTQSFGSTGAMTILASLVYTLTEHPQCNYLYLDFEEGDHAAPGIYSRSDYMDDFVICY